MAAERLLRAPRAVVGEREVPVAVRIRDGVVVDLSAYDVEAGAAEVVVLADDEVLLPGLVDTHVHVNEPGRTEWEGFASATRAAAAGGVTTIVDMPLNSIPPTTTVAALIEKRAVARAQAYVDVGFWGGAVPGNVRDLEALHRAGVFGFKCFLLDSGVEEFPHLTATEFATAMTETARLGALMLVHAEDADAIVQCGHGPSYAGFLESRPDAAEERAIDLVIRTAHATGGRAHVVHLSAAGAVPALRAAREGGVDISVETCPHYLHFDAAQIADGATELKCCPPIRDAANRDALWAALEAGDVDFVVTDHSPSTAELKGSGDFAADWGGIASLQLGLPAVWTSARGRGVGLAEVARWMATAPARRVGLAGKGEIAVGADADLCVFAPDETFVVDPARLHHKNPVSAYAGRTLTGTVRATWLRGAPVDLDAPPRGQLLTRGRAMTYYVPRGGLPDQTELTTDRAVFTEAYAVLPRGTMRDIVTSQLPHWSSTRAWVIARPLSGFAETFSQYVVEVSPGGGSDRPEPDPSAEAVLFVVDGTVHLTIAGLGHRLGPGAYAFLPPGTPWSLRNDSGATSTFHWIRKAYENVEGIDAPEAFVVQETDVSAEPMPGTDGAWSTQRFVDPLDTRHDMHVNIVSFEPGGAIPFPETHVMEHGLYVLEGKAVYLLNKDWVEVQAGDFMWLRAFCPQACYAGGPGRFRYLLYKDVNRHPRLSVAHQPAPRRTPAG